MKKFNNFKAKISLLLAIVLLFAVFTTGCNEKDSNKNINPPVAGDEIVPSDYSDKNNWLNVPDNPQKEVDVFYLYPTVWGRESEDESTVCSIDHVGMREAAPNLLQSQASVFEKECNIYAPFYRQVDAGYALSQQGMLETYIGGVPYTDCVAAFEYYLKNYNNGRPFIIAGHSQGATVAKLMLFNYLEDKPDILKRMVASYVIGYSITEQELTENPHVKFAQEADDFGVVISYNTEAKGYDGVNNTWKEGSVAINPISWTRTESLAPATKSLGAAFVENGQLVKKEHFADAVVNLKRGTVQCSTADPEIYGSKNTEFFPVGVFHSNDYSFYYYDLQKNVGDRISSYMKDVNT